MSNNLASSYRSEFRKSAWFVAVKCVKIFLSEAISSISVKMFCNFFPIHFFVADWVQWTLSSVQCTNASNNYRCVYPSKRWIKQCHSEISNHIFSLSFPLNKRFTVDMQCPCPMTAIFITCNVQQITLNHIQIVFRRQNEMNTVFSFCALLLAQFNLCDLEVNVK